MHNRSIIRISYLTHKIATNAERNQRQGNKKDKWGSTDMYVKDYIRSDMQVQAFRQGHEYIPVFSTLLFCLVCFA